MNHGNFSGWFWNLSFFDVSFNNYLVPIPAYFSIGDVTVARRLQVRSWLAVECKSATGKLRPEQAHFKACCDDSDLLHVVGGLDDVIAKLTHLGYLNAQKRA